VGMGKRDLKKHGVAQQKRSRGGKNTSTCGTKTNKEAGKGRERVGWERLPERCLNGGFQAEIKKIKNIILRARRTGEETLGAIEKKKKGNRKHSENRRRKKQEKKEQGQPGDREHCTENPSKVQEVKIVGGGGAPRGGTKIGG